MRKGLIVTLVSLFWALLLACQKPKTADPSDEEAAIQDVKVEAEDADQQAKKVPATCRSLNIPSYDFLIKDLSALRCDSCHNETFAWKGIVLTQYDTWKTYVKPIRNRIFYNLLTQPLEAGEQEIFLAWIDNGLPRTDADCAGLK